MAAEVNTAPTKSHRRCARDDACNKHRFALSERRSRGPPALEHRETLMRRRVVQTSRLSFDESDMIRGGSPSPFLYALTISRALRTDHGRSQLAANLCRRQVCGGRTVTEKVKE